MRFSGALRPLPKRALGSWSCTTNLSAPPPGVPGFREVPSATPFRMLHVNLAPLWEFQDFDRLLPERPIHTPWLPPRKEGPLPVWGKASRVMVGFLGRLVGCGLATAEEQTTFATLPLILGPPHEGRESETLDFSWWPFNFVWWFDLSTVA